ncbi:MAG: hypothetical protein ACQEP5_08210 [Actinomycetota bacterium]
MAKDNNSLEQLDDQIYEWEEEVAVLNAEAENSEGETKKKLGRRIRDLETKIKNARKKLGQIREKNQDSYY